MVVQVLKKYDDRERRTGYFRWKKKKSKNENHLFWQCWEGQTTSLIAFIFGVLERRLCVYHAGLKVDVSREILTVVMMSYYETVRSCKRHTVVCRAFCFWRFALLFLGLVTHYRESWFWKCPCPTISTFSKGYTNIKGSKAQACTWCTVCGNHKTNTT